MPTFAPATLRELTLRVLTAAGASAQEASLVADLLVRSHLVGHDSHGVLRIPQYVDMIRAGHLRPGAEVTVVREAPAMAVLDGGWGFGQVVATRAVQVAIGKARDVGVAVVSARHCGHVGRLGDYVEMAAAEQMVGVAAVNGHGGWPAQAPFGGRERRLSANPIAFGFPAGGRPPVVVDITSSVVAEGKLRLKRNRDERVPEGWLIDAEGRPTTSPHAYYADPPGALLPFGGSVAHKGYGLALTVDLLSGALSGAGCTGSHLDHPGNGLFVAVMDVRRFLPLKDYEAEVEAFLGRLKSCPPAEGFSEVLVPGEPEARLVAERQRTGITVDETTLEHIRRAAGQVGAAVEDLIGPGS